MVARINTSKNISKALNYNEQKVQQGRAQLLHAAGFIKDAERLNFYDKISQFQRNISLNEKATTNTLHVSLNFDPGETISDIRLTEIAAAYMDKIGFGMQPYLVYRHNDAGHPHIHIVSTNIQRDGQRLSMHNLGRNQSEAARKEIEVDFGLVKAFERNRSSARISAIQTPKIMYGKAETRRSIANVLGGVLNQYKYTSLPELNAVLKLYNVQADPGIPGSRMHKNRGVVYRVLDSQGNKVGVPIKASAFHLNARLNDLEKRFLENASARNPHKKRLQTAIKWILTKKIGGLEDLICRLELQNISTVIRRGKEDIIYGITFVDHNTKCVFNGSDLGKEFAVKAIIEKCAEGLRQPGPVYHSRGESEHSSLIYEDAKLKVHDQKDNASGITVVQSGSPNTGNGVIPYQFTRKKKRRKKRLTK